MIQDATFPALFVGDQPAEQAIIQVDDDLEQYPNRDVLLREPLAATAQTLTGITTVVDDEIHVALNGDYFDVPGEWTLQILLSGSGVRQSLAPLAFVVEADDGWLTMAQIRAEWRDAPDEDVTLYRVLQTAREQVLAYGPEPVTLRPPANYLQAQRMQARNIWNAAKSDPSGAIGDEGFVIRPYPMDSFIRQTLRPKRAVPVMGRA